MSGEPHTSTLITTQLTYLQSRCLVVRKDNDSRHVFSTTFNLGWIKLLPSAEPSLSTIVFFYFRWIIFLALFSDHFSGQPISFCFCWCYPLVRDTIQNVSNIGSRGVFDDVVGNLKIVEIQRTIFERTVHLSFYIIFCYH